MARRSDELGYIDRDTMQWIPVDVVAEIPRGNIISETYREYVESIEHETTTGGE